MTDTRAFRRRSLAAVASGFDLDRSDLSLSICSERESEIGRCKLADQQGRCYQKTLDPQ
jgi:hypothetical protein